MKNRYLSVNKEGDWIKTLLEVLKDVSKIYKSKKRAMTKDEN